MKIAIISNFVVLTASDSKSGQVSGSKLKIESRAGGQLGGG